MGLEDMLAGERIERTRSISVSFRSDTLAMVDAIAETQGVSRSKVIGALIAMEYESNPSYPALTEQ